MSKALYTVFIAAVLTIAAAAQTVQDQNNGVAPTPGDATVSHVVSILKPAAGEKLRQTFVTVTFALSNPAASAAGTPNFELRLDAQDPVTTSSTEHTFTGLLPGSHTVTVALVDANGTPVMGGKSTVQFTVLRQAARLRGPQAIAAALRLEPGTDIRIQGTSRPAPLTNQGGALPLLSVIGFGVLVGGITSAMKTRG